MDHTAGPRPKGVGIGGVLGKVVDLHILGVQAFAQRSWGADTSRQQRLGQQGPLNDGFVPGRLWGKQTSGNKDRGSLPEAPQAPAGGDGAVGSSAINAREVQAAQHEAALFCPHGSDASNRLTLPRQPTLVPGVRDTRFPLSTMRARATKEHEHSFCLAKRAGFRRTWPSLPRSGLHGSTGTHHEVGTKPRSSTHLTGAEKLLQHADPHAPAPLTRPRFYVPQSALVHASDLKKAETAIENTSNHAYFGALTVGNRTTSRILIFDDSVKDLIKFDFHAMDQWFEEDVPVYGHPKDPYKRIDILHSTRRVKVGVEGVVLAESAAPLFLLETTLRVRYYLPPTSVRWEYLRKSDTETLCPYKGRANYYDVVVNGKVYRDLVWFYRYPTICNINPGKHSKQVLFGSTWIVTAIDANKIMTRLKGALASARERVVRHLPNRVKRLVSSTQADVHTPEPCAIDSVDSPISPQAAVVALAPATARCRLHRLPTGQHVSSIPLTAIRKVPATLTTTPNAAQVGAFSHGSGLLVYRNGALVSAARVALKINIATLEFVERLPLAELGAIGACLGAAFADKERPVDISWAEVGDETEREWREAERVWEPFSGGPYRACELREDMEMTSGVASGVGREGTTSQATMAVAELHALPCDSASSHTPSLVEDQAIELIAIKRPWALCEEFSGPCLDKENVPYGWSPGKGSGPIMSDDAFDALPDWSDGESELGWVSAAEEWPELDGRVERW
ncbi:hypothetical protein OPT61_g7881 [Boeremia exigua]|uniref:Uncharacterized protein n=1 Tax=Boeremia exigua TaxID=749465 RepID=A0ACC2I0W3_9PLEO|nr:hypothetical protein OPT61_g7881 [Boeremia exigua]